MELGEGAGAAAIKVDPDKYLHAKIIEISFDGYDACREQVKITAPHWPAETDGYNKSKKAAVLQLGKDKKSTAKVKINIDSKGVSGNGKLVGRLGNLVFEGDVPLAKGEPTVTVTIKENPSVLLWARGNMTWEVSGGELVAMAGATNVELFFVFHDPAKMKFFSSKGVWTEALRFIFKESRLQGVKDISEAIKKVTQCCFGLPQHKYDIRNGAPLYGGATTLFMLKKYMDKSVDEDVNCYDQAYAVVTFSGALGLSVDGYFLMPYGYLKYTQLVGRGACNNPFPYSKYRSVMVNRSLLKRIIPGTAPVQEDYLVVDPKDEYRAGFRNHMFCGYSDRIYDACAGAAIGEDDLFGYMNSAIDIAPNIPEKMRGYDEGATKPWQIALEDIGYPHSEAALKAHHKYSVKNIVQMGLQVNGVE